MQLNKSISNKQMPMISPSTTSSSKGRFAFVVDRIRPKKRNKSKQASKSKESDQKIINAEKPKKMKSYKQVPFGKRSNGKIAEKSDSSHCGRCWSEKEPQAIEKKIVHQSPVASSKNHQLQIQNEPVPNISSNRVVSIHRNGSFRLKDSETSPSPPAAQSRSYCVEQMIQLHGYEIVAKLADTLQGTLWRCRVVDADPNKDYYGDTVVIKVASKELHNQGITILSNGAKKRVQENIISEKTLLKELTDAGAPAYMTRFVDFFEDARDYYLCMEDGQKDLFAYVVECHKYIRSNQLDRRQWRLTVKKIFKQIVILVDWLHHTQRVCHMDISLENMLIKNAQVFIDHNGNVRLSRDFEIKFCDFGLAERFEHGDFRSTKYVGKTRYKSPELWTKQLVFDARANDIWSLGVSLFMMILGAPPYKLPEYTDANFKSVINGDTLSLISSWGRARYMTPQILELLQGMLAPERSRFTIEHIKRHSWVNLI
jgi:tRNA A-37 threonylcarbamoyl transferase component Bud32